MKLDYTYKWLLQKVFAVLFLITSFYTIYSINTLEFYNYQIVTLWFKNYLNSFSVLVMFLSIFLHSNIGLTSIIDDYVHDEFIKKKKNNN